MAPGWRDLRRRVGGRASTYLQLGEDGEKAAEPRHLAGGTGGGEEVTSASTYLQLGDEGEKAAERRHLAGGTGEGEEVTVLAPTFSWVRMESRLRRRGARLEGLVEEWEVTSAGTYLQLGEDEE